MSESRAEMVERVERAIVETLERTGDWKATARAAIEALKDPPDELLDRLESVFDNEGWNAMIDAALAPLTD